MSSLGWAAGIGALLTGIAGIVTAWLAVRKARREGDERCHEQLARARSEAEATAATLHRLRMTHPEVIE